MISGHKKIGMALPPRFREHRMSEWGMGWVQWEDDFWTCHNCWVHKLAAAVVPAPSLAPQHSRTDGVSWDHIPQESYWQLMVAEGERAIFFSAMDTLKLYTAVINSLSMFIQATLIKFYEWHPTPNKWDERRRGSRCTTCGGEKFSGWEREEE